jgi:hypothetical protein
MARKALIKEPPTPTPKESEPSPKEVEVPAKDPQPAIADDSHEPNAIRWILAQPAGYPAGLISPTDIALRPGDVVGLGKPVPSSEAPASNEARYIFTEKGSALVRCGFAVFLHVATSDNSKEG